jgi:hypothetical protein
VTPAVADDDGFIVKDVTFSGIGISTYRHEINKADFSALGGDVVRATPQTVLGQGDTDPPKVFTNHCLTKAGGKYYDVSYGTPSFTDAKAYENGVFAGYFKKTDKEDDLEGRKNNTTNATSEVSIKP